MSGPCATNLASKRKIEATHGLRFTASPPAKYVV